jgi:hypothetical protein
VRGKKNAHTKKNLKQKTLAAWCTQHRNQVHKSRIWLPDEKHHHHREDQRGDHELACSRSKNQRPIGGDRKLEQENQTRRTDLCGRKNGGKDLCAGGKKETKHSTSGTQRNDFSISTKNITDSYNHGGHHLPPFFDWN